MSYRVAAEELIGFHDQLPLGGGDFMCVYGSSAYDADTIESDIDLFVVTDAAELLTPAFQSRFVNFVDCLHRRYGRSLDNEVPYDNKLLYSHAEIRTATNLGCFTTDPVTQKLQVPEVVKDSEFLCGAGIKQRLALNALTSPHVVMSQTDSYRRHKKAAEMAVTAIGIALCDDPVFGQEDVCGNLTEGPEGVSGEMYLGYKTEYPAVENHLEALTAQSLATLTAAGLLACRAHTYTRPESFDPFRIAQYFTNYKTTI